MINRSVKILTKSIKNCNLASLCTAAPPLKKKSERSSFPIFFEGRGGCTQATIWRDIGTERARVGSRNKVSHVIKTEPKAAMFPRARQCTAYRVNGKELQIFFMVDHNKSFSKEQS